MVCCVLPEKSLDDSLHRSMEGRVSVLKAFIRSSMDSRLGYDILFVRHTGWLLPSCFFRGVGLGLVSKCTSTHLCEFEGMPCKNVARPSWE
jgi:hypothetical protein